MDEEQKKRISESMLAAGIKRTEEHKKVLSKTHTARWATWREEHGKTGYTKQWVNTLARLAETEKKDTN